MSFYGFYLVVVCVSHVQSGVLFAKMNSKRVLKFSFVAHTFYIPKVEKIFDIIVCSSYI